MKMNYLDRLFLMPFHEVYLLDYLIYCYGTSIAMGTNHTGSSYKLSSREWLANTYHALILTDDCNGNLFLIRGAPRRSHILHVFHIAHLLNLDC